MLFQSTIECILKTVGHWVLIVLLVHTVLGAATDNTEDVDRISRLGKRTVRAFLGTFLGKKKLAHFRGPFRPSFPLRHGRHLGRKPHNSHQFTPSKPPKEFDYQESGWSLSGEHEDHFFEEIGHIKEDLKGDFISNNVDSLAFKEQFSVDSPHSNGFDLHDSPVGSLEQPDVFLDQLDHYNDVGPPERPPPSSFQTFAFQSPQGSGKDIHDILSGAIYRGDVPHKDIRNTNDKVSDDLTPGGYDGLSPDIISFIRLKTISYLHDKQNH